MTSLPSLPFVGVGETRLSRSTSLNSTVPRSNANSNKPSPLQIPRSNSTLSIGSHPKRPSTLASSYQDRSLASSQSSIHQTDRSLSQFSLHNHAAQTPYLSNQPSQKSLVFESEGNLFQTQGQPQSPWTPAPRPHTHYSLHEPYAAQQGVGLKLDRVMALVDQVGRLEHQLMRREEDVKAMRFILDSLRQREVSQTNRMSKWLKKLNEAQLELK